MFVISDMKNDIILIARKGMTGPSKVYTARKVTGRRKLPMTIKEPIQ